jgi:hypothetical protein
MDKKTKLYLGLGVVAVGAYLLFKSKKAKTPALTSSVEPAKFVGAAGFASVYPRQIAADGMINSLNSPTQKYSADGFASVYANQKFNAGGPEGNRMKNLINTVNSPTYRPMSGGMINSTDVVGARAGSQNSGIFANKPFVGDVANMVGANGEPVFANLFGRNRRKRKGSVEIGPLEGSFNELPTRVGSVEIGPLEGSFAADGGMINSTDVVGARVGSQNSGIFANKPFVGDVANMVGADGEACFANQSGKFFKPRTARYGQNEGVFTPSKPKRTLPVEPNRPMPITQPAPLNNMVGADGVTGGFFSVHDGFLK